MFKKVFIIPFCLVIGIFFTTYSYSQQDDPTPTDSDKTEKVTEEKKETTETKTEEMKKDTAEQQGATITAKSFSDGSILYVNSKVLFKITAKDDIEVDKIEYKVDDGAPVIYQNPFSIDKEGTHTIKYYSTDKFGNKELEKAFSVVVDSTGPSIAASGAPIKKIGEKIYFAKELTLNISATDALSGVNKVEYSTDGTTYKEYTEPVVIPAKGEVSLKIKAIDNVNNTTDQFTIRVTDETGNEVELKDATVKLSTDDVAPVVEIKSDKELKQIGGKNVASSDVKYTITAKDDGSGVASILYRIDGKGDFGHYKNELIFLTNGKHQIDAKAIDKVGNVSSVASLSVYVDILPPNSNIEAVDK